MLSVTPQPTPSDMPSRSVVREVGAGGVADHRGDRRLVRGRGSHDRLAQAEGSRSGGARAPSARCPWLRSRMRTMPWSRAAASSRITFARLTLIDVRDCPPASAPRCNRARRRAPKDPARGSAPWARRACAGASGGAGGERAESVTPASRLSNRAGQCSPRVATCGRLPSAGRSRLDGRSLGRLEICYTRITNVPAVTEHSTVATRHWRSR